MVFLVHLPDMSQYIKLYKDLEKKIRFCKLEHTAYNCVMRSSYAKQTSRNDRWRLVVFVVFSFLCASVVFYRNYYNVSSGAHVICDEFYHTLVTSVLWLMLVGDIFTCSTTHLPHGQVYWKHYVLPLVRYYLFFHTLMGYGVILLRSVVVSFNDIKTLLFTVVIFVTYMHMSTILEVKEIARVASTAIVKTSLGTAYESFGTMLNVVEGLMTGTLAAVLGPANQDVVPKSSWFNLDSMPYFLIPFFLPYISELFILNLSWRSIARILPFLNIVNWFIFSKVSVMVEVRYTAYSPLLVLAMVPVAYHYLFCYMVDKWWMGPVEEMLLRFFTWNTWCFFLFLL